MPAKLAVRFTYATNGQELYGIDMESGWEGETSYPTPKELWHRTFPNEWRERFSAVSYPDKGGSWSLRFYQEIAVNRVLQRIADWHDRVLLTLATGTGKTSIAFQIAFTDFGFRADDWIDPFKDPLTQKSCRQYGKKSKALIRRFVCQ